MEARGSFKVGEFLRSIRVGRRITGKQVAEQLGVTQGTVSKVETGLLRADVDYLLRCV